MQIDLWVSENLHNALGEWLTDVVFKLVCFVVHFASIVLEVRSEISFEEPVVTNHFERDGCPSFRKLNSLVRFVVDEVRSDNLFIILVTAGGFTSIYSAIADVFTRPSNSCWRQRISLR